MLRWVLKVQSVGIKYSFGSGQIESIFNRIIWFWKTYTEMSPYEIKGFMENLLRGSNNVDTTKGTHFLIKHHIFPNIFSGSVHVEIADDQNDRPG